MNSFRSFSRAALASLGLFIAVTFAHAETAKPAPAATAEQVAAYPLNICVVSEEKLGEMGKPIDYVYQKEGQPDRLVRLCCKGCVKDFKKDPEKYLKQIDDAAAAKTKQS
ncbi:hypothetical protein [Oleiharenicola lentus]|uniref:hypothetical protein n=1 Tax=Oleiharenicola lentus TaxID=2508720 RepID=UPI003F67F2A0